FRDLDRGIEPHIPDHYFADNDPSKPPIVSWRSHGQLFYTNWLNHYVYQTTPYDISKL
ncbi:MAG: homoserine O-succinyltransferase, partial [Intestinibacillus sp.]